MWKTLLLKIRKIEEKYGSKLNEPVTEDDFNNLKQTVRNQLTGAVLPEEYLEFLKEANGLDFNGLVIYGVDHSLQEAETDEPVEGFVETNKIWHENEWQNKFLFFGDSDTAWYCFDLDEKKYLELDKPSGTIMNKYSDFGSLLEAALKSELTT